MRRRLNNLSIYRLIATLCVLQFHIFYILYPNDVTYEILLSKGVQGLTALSGFLYSQKLISDNKQFFITNLKKILLPALICFMIMALWNLVFMFVHQSWNYIALFAGNRVYEKQLIIQPANYYYLGHILLCYLLTPILQKSNKHAFSICFGVIGVELLLGFFFDFPIISSTYMVGYIIGKRYFASLTDPDKKFSFKQLGCWLSLTLLSLGIYIILTLFKFNEGFFIRNLYYMLCNLVAASFGVASFYLIIYLLKWTNNHKGYKFFMFTDKLSFEIYLFNQAFMIGSMNVAALVSPMWAKTILVYVATILASFVAYLISYFLTHRKKKNAVTASS